MNFSMQVYRYIFGTGWTIVAEGNCESRIDYVGDSVSFYIFSIEAIQGSGPYTLYIDHP